MQLVRILLVTAHIGLQARRGGLDAAAAAPEAVVAVVGHALSVAGGVDAQRDAGAVGKGVAEPGGAGGPAGVGVWVGGWLNVVWEWVRVRLV